MSLFPDERQFELKELFFETAAELLQALNEEGLKLEQHHGDAEFVREVRRTVHTLKGDAAACGFEELSSLAHDLEDVLTPQIAASSGDKLADIVLAAADVFASMLSSYRESSPIASAHPIRERIRQLVAHPEPKNIVPYKLSGRFAWTEYEQMSIDRARRQGQHIYNIALAVDPNCPMKSAAMQLVTNVLCQLGDVLAAFPDSSIPPEQIDVMEFAIASSQAVEAFEKKCRIPSVISDVLIETTNSGTIIEQPPAPAHEETGDVLGISDPNAEFTESSTASSSQSASVKLRVDAERIDAVLNLVGELVIGKSMLMQNINEFEKRFNKDSLHTKFSDALAFQARVLNDLQKSVMKIRMVPVEQLFRRFPRMVRDLAKGYTISSLEYSRDGRILAIGDWGGLVRLLDTRTWREVQRIQGPSDMPGLGLSPDRNRLASF